MSQEQEMIEISSEATTYILLAKGICGLLVAVCAAGVTCNALLLFTTIRSKNLRSPCNILIGSCALFDMLHQLGNFPQGYGIIRDVSMSSYTCSIILFLPEIGVSGGTFSVLSIGIDRFLSIAVPNTYRNMNKTKYLAGHYSAIAIYCLSNIFLMVYFFEEQEHFCGIAHVYHGEALTIWSYSGVIVNISSFLFYVRTWRLIRKQSKNLEIEQLRRIFRTIVLVTVMELGGYTICQIIISVQNLFDLPYGLHMSIMMVAGNSVNAGIASKFLVYYFSSTEYHKAFTSQFKKESSTSSQVSTISSKTSMKK